MKHHDRSWLSLLAFFAVTTLACSLVFAAVFAGVTVAIAGGESAQAADDQQVDPLVPSQTFSGVLTDAHCGSRHMDSEQSASACTRACARKGSKYEIVDGDKKYELAGNSWEFEPFAGQRVTLSGVAHGNTIKVSSASMHSADGRQPR